jgi:hypothetical protein
MEYFCVKTNRMIAKMLNSPKTDTTSYTIFSLDPVKSLQVSEESGKSAEVMPSLLSRHILLCYTLCANVYLSG